MNNDQINWLDDDGHLTAEGRAAYVDYAYRNEIEKVPEEVRQHVQTCLLCATDVEALYAAYKEQMQHEADQPASKTGKQVHLQPAATNRTLRPWRLAASIVLPLLMAAGIYWGYSTHTDSALFNTYNQVYELPQTRGANQTSSYAEAIQLYQAGRYAEAADALSSMASNNAEVEFYRAHALLQAGRYNDALLAYQGVIGTSDRFDTEATWYLCLTYLADNKPTQAKQSLLTLTSNPNTETFYAKKAQALLADLNSFWRF